MRVKSQKVTHELGFQSRLTLPSRFFLDIGGNYRNRYTSELAYYLRWQE